MAHGSRDASLLHTMDVRMGMETAVANRVALGRRDALDAYSLVVGPGVAGCSNSSDSS